RFSWVVGVGLIPLARRCIATRKGCLSRVFRKYFNKFL
ncbi:MAG: hypothetical protein ACI9AF_001448, partial [Granulosicoccus sp.]